MKYLIHYDALRSHAHGLWWSENGILKNFYPNPESPTAARGRLMVFNKSNKAVSWEAWFDQMTTRAPYLEDWEVYDSMGIPPEEFLAALQPHQPLVS